MFNMGSAPSLSDIAAVTKMEMVMVGVMETDGGY